MNLFERESTASQRALSEFPKQLLRNGNWSEVHSRFRPPTRAETRDPKEQPVFQRAGQLLAACLDGLGLGEYAPETGNLAVEAFSVPKQLITSFRHPRPQVLG